MILMQQNIEYMIGSMEDTVHAKPLPVFDRNVIELLDDVSKEILKIRNVREFEDLVSIAFWIRKASLIKMKQQYETKDRLGYGLMFHITPSNIPVQFLYSLVVSLLAGNANIIRMSQKEFEQGRIICGALRKSLEKYPSMLPYVCLLRYGHDKEITDELSLKCDGRIVWGGDATISKIRESPLSAQAFELTFADRFSLCIINGQKYLEAPSDTKEKLAHGFYTDTFFSDQNACNSPRMVVWIGEKESCRNAAEIFWNLEKEVVEQKYALEQISGVNKLLQECTIAIEMDAKRDRKNSYGNYVNVVNVGEVSPNISDCKGNGGLFFQAFVENVRDIIKCVQKDWQTLSYYGVCTTEILCAIRETGVKGIDRIVPIGQSMPPSLQWEGIDFIYSLSRHIHVL